jgi:hypothetical protein
MNDLISWQKSHKETLLLQRWKALYKKSIGESRKIVTDYTHVPSALSV